MKRPTKSSPTPKPPTRPRPKRPPAIPDGLELFHPITARWFHSAYGTPTAPQREGWPAIARGDSTLILAPTGTGKTLTAFLWCLDRLLFRPGPITPGTKVLYISPLKALAVDVERNLQAPLAGITNLAAQLQTPTHPPTISTRTGDTKPNERARFKRKPGEILITTPESLYLLLTSSSAEALRSIETVIIDEIHALVPTKRGAHLMLSLERLQTLCNRPLQRIGLSATQRPLEEVARFLGGAEPTNQPALSTSDSLASPEPESAFATFRPVTIVNAGARKRLELSVQVSVQDLATLGPLNPPANNPDSPTPRQTSIWQSIHPRLVEIIRSRTSTLIFVNNRRTAERLAGAINELAGESLARAHHGSLAAAQRSEIEQLLKDGQLRALVCTSSLELGIDMGAIDMVIQIEAPPSVASALQRIGRAGHQVGAPSTGIIFPKYRADLLACAAATQAMHQGLVESTRFLRNPLDILAQQIVAIVAHPPLPAASLAPTTDDASPGISHAALFALVRSSAPFATLSLTAFNGVLDMLSGLYPSDEFAGLRPRITWDRISQWLTPRHGARSIAVLNGGTIPDRGLYGVFLANSPKPVRVGELDEEMVFEARAGETFLLGASTWRIDQITHDRVLVTPAPGQPGKLPFWHGDRAGRPIEFGRRIGELVRELRSISRGAAIAKLTREHDLDPEAAENVLRYLTDQELATHEVPDDRTILIERVRDELGDWRVCVLTPFGSRVHTPWAMAAAANAAANGLHVETMWTDDGFVLRFPDTDTPPDPNLILLDPQQAMALVTEQLGHTPLFAGRFREAAARALLLPRNRAQGRAPLWQQRKRASDLLSVAGRFPSFPILLETYRECLRDVFDMPALFETLKALKNGTIHLHTTDSRTPSPFAGAVLFGYVANFIYDGDAPFAERRAQALSIDQDQLRELLGDADLRELLSEEAIRDTQEELQCLVDGYKAHNIDGIHDLLLRLGDLTIEELQERCEPPDLSASIPKLANSGRVLEIVVAGTKRFIAAEDAGRFRGSLTSEVTARIPESFLESSREPLVDIVRRYARTHGPFSSAEIERRYDVSKKDAEDALQRLVSAGRVMEGGFTPGGLQREWIDAEVLRAIRRRSLARLRKEIEPVEPHVFARFLCRWQGVVQRRRGLDVLLDVVELLQGVPLPASLLESEILPARIDGYQPSDLDTLIAAGEVAWAGLESQGEHDGRIALYLAEDLPSLWMPRVSQSGADLDDRQQAVVEYLRRNGASFFPQLHEGVGGGYPGETLNSLWALVWQGLVLNDSLHPLRAYCEKSNSASRRHRISNRPMIKASFRSRRTTPASGEGRWSLSAHALVSDGSVRADQTKWSHATARQLLARYGVVFREAALSSAIPGGFSAIYDVLKAFEESGRVRRGYFVARLGGSQFALPAAVDALRSCRTARIIDHEEAVILAATDPANPYGTLIRWPSAMEDHLTMSRAVGARVVLMGGHLRAYLRRGSSALQVLLPEEEPDRSHAAQQLARFLVECGRKQAAAGRGWDFAGTYIKTVNGKGVHKHWFAKFLVDAGFRPAPNGLNLQRT